MRIEDPTNKISSTVRSAMSDLGINVILGDRVDLSSITAAGGQEQKVRTLSGREIQAGLVVCHFWCPSRRQNSDEQFSCFALANSRIPSFSATCFLPR